MIGSKFVRATLVLATLAGALLLTGAGGAGATAPRAGDLMTSLNAAGYAVAITGNVPYPDLTIWSMVITIRKDGSEAKVEVLDYASEDEFRRDWSAQDGSRPAPNAGVRAFDGRVLYWNERSVLAVDFRAPNDPAIAQAAGDAFLGRPLAAGPATGVSDGRQAGAPVSPPATGDADLLARTEQGEGRPLPFLRLAIYAAGCAGAAFLFGLSRLKPVAARTR